MALFILDSGCSFRGAVPNAANLEELEQIANRVGEGIDLPGVPGKTSAFAKCIGYKVK